MPCAGYPYQGAESYSREGTYLQYQLEMNTRQVSGRGASSYRFDYRRRIKIVRNPFSLHSAAWKVGFLSLLPGNGKFEIKRTEGHMKAHKRVLLWFLSCSLSLSSSNQLLLALFTALHLKRKGYASWRQPRVRRD